MKTKREEKLEQELLVSKEKLLSCKQELHRERQKNRDMSQSRERYKIKNKRLAQAVKEAASIKKNERLEFLPNSI